LIGLTPKPSTRTEGACAASALAFREGVFDAAVCAHVLYHIPQDEQKFAVEELYRTLRREASCVIIYIWPTKRLKIKRFMAKNPKTLSFALKIVNSARGILSSKEKSERPPRPALYFGPHDYRWLKKTLPDNWATEIRCWRSLGTPSLRRFVPNNFLGRFLLDFVFTLENAFPHAMGRIGRYPMIIIEKKWRHGP